MLKFFGKVGFYGFAGHLMGQETKGSSSKQLKEAITFQEAYK